MVAGVAALATACSSTASERPAPELADHVDLPRFMGRWYVLAHTPTRLDQEPYNATETYTLEADGDIETAYEFFDGSFDGDYADFYPTGHVYNAETNAEWRMTFFWVFAQPYLILYVDPNYQYTVIGHPNREMMWIMARQPQIPDAQYEALEQVLRDRDYDLEKLRRVPQQPDGDRRPFPE